MVITEKGTEKRERVRGVSDAGMVLEASGGSVDRTHTQYEANALQSCELEPKKIANESKAVARESTGAKELASSCFPVPQYLAT